MSAEQMTSLVRRKARTAREAQAARTMSLARALRLTAAKQADRLMDLPLSALSITRRTMGAQDVPDCLNAPSLTLLMDGPSGQVASAVLDPVLVAGLVQQQTMGKVLAAPESGEARRHTTTDAALCAPFIESLLSRAALLPEDAEEGALLHGYRFGVWAPEPRQAQLALDASDYTVVEMILDMAAGARAGKLTLILPQPTAKPEAKYSPADAPVAPAPKVNLAQNVMGLKADLMVALTRIKMPLQQASNLKPGDLVNLDLSSMAQALVIDGNGRAIARGTLGQIDGVRAVQVEQQSKRQRTEPRRRAADRDELDMPDVTAPTHDAASSNEILDIGLPSFSDMDVFGNLDDLPDLPDMDDVAKAADEHMAGWDKSKNARGAPADKDDARQSQTGW